MDLFIAFAPMIMVIAAILLSISSFNGGFNFAHLIFLKKMRPLVDEIVKSGDNTQLIKLNHFLSEISVEKNKVTFKDWLFYHWRDKNGL